MLPTSDARLANTVMEREVQNKSSVRECGNPVETGSYPESGGRIKGILNPATLQTSFSCSLTCEWSSKHSWQALWHWEYPQYRTCKRSQLSPPIMFSINTLLWFHLDHKLMESVKKKVFIAKCNSLESLQTKNLSQLSSSSFFHHLIKVICIDLHL